MTNRVEGVLMAFRFVWNRLFCNTALPKIVPKVRFFEFEQLESRNLMTFSITGHIYHDLAEDGFDAADVALGGVNVALFRDGGNGLFESGTGSSASGDDILIENVISDLTSGGYSFSVSITGTYFVVQASVATGLIQRPAQRVQSVEVSQSDIVGVEHVVIDTFDTTFQSVTATLNGNNPDFSSTIANESLGGERDLMVFASSGIVSMTSDSPVAKDILSIELGANSNGTRVLSYDGLDGDSQVLATNGLGGIDLTSAGAATHFRFQIGADVGAELTIQVNSGANASTRTIAIPTTLGGMPIADLEIPFADFSATVGAGANFASVGAIQISVHGQDGVDVSLDSISTFGRRSYSINFANLSPMAIGDQIFRDNDRDGRFNPSQSFSRMSGVSLELFNDRNSNGAFDVGIDDPVLNSSNLPMVTVSDSAGTYLFTDLFPGRYFVVIPGSQFVVGAPAEGLVATEARPIGVNNVNKGIDVANVGVVSSVVILNAEGGPTNDGDTDSSTDLSIDIGLAPRRQLLDFQITASGPETALVGSMITYTLTVYNDGPSSGLAAVQFQPADGIRVISASANGRPELFLPSSATDNLLENPDPIRFTSFGLSPGRSNDSLMVVAEVLPGAPEFLVNIARIFVGFSSFPPLDVNTNNNVAFITTNALQFDLAVTKSAPPVVSAGEFLTYTINVTNLSDRITTRIPVQDFLPSGVTFVSGTVFKGNNLIGTVVASTSNLVTTEISSISPGQLVVVTIVVQVSNSATGTLVNRVVINKEGDTDPTNNSATATTLVVDRVVNRNSISGYVYADVDNDGQRFVMIGSNQIAQTGIPNVLVQLINRTTGETLQSVTDPDGFYSFNNVADNIYDLVEFQPINFVDGKETAGTPGLAVLGGMVAQDQFRNLSLRGGVQANEYNFGERGLRPFVVSKTLLLASTPSSAELAGVFSTGIANAFIATTAGRLFVDNSNQGGPVQILSSQSYRPLAASQTGGLSYNMAEGEKVIVLLQSLNSEARVSFSSDDGRDMISLGELTNPQDSADVDNDGFVSPLDALVLVNLINQRGVQMLKRGGDRSIAFVDPNKDGWISPLDVLVVINEINRRNERNSHAEAEGEGDESSEFLSQFSLISPRQSTTDGVPPANNVYGTIYQFRRFKSCTDQADRIVKHVLAREAVLDFSYVNPSSEEGGEPEESSDMIFELLSCEHVDITFCAEEFFSMES